MANSPPRLPPLGPDTLPFSVPVSMQLVTSHAVVEERRAGFNCARALRGRAAWDATDCPQRSRARRPRLVIGLESYLLIGASRILKRIADQISSLS